MIPKFPKKPTTPLPSLRLDRAGAVKPKSQSSNVAGFVHNPEDKTLEVTFHGGRVYRYNGVSADQHAAFTKAESKGSYLNEHIIPHHTFSRLR